MKVIAYISSPDDLGHVRACLDWAMREPELKSAGATHIDGKASFFERRKSGTVVISVQAKKEPEQL